MPKTKNKNKNKNKKQKTNKQTKNCILYFNPISPEMRKRSIENILLRNGA